MKVLVCYDIPDTKRRTRLRKALLAFGEPVQYSVFECDLTRSHVAKLQNAIRKIIRAETDNVRYYLLCGKCIESVEFFGGKEFVTRKDVYIV